MATFKNPIISSLDDAHRMYGPLNISLWYAKGDDWNRKRTGDDAQLVQPIAFDVDDIARWVGVSYDIQQWRLVLDAHYVAVEGVHGPW